MSTNDYDKDNQTTSDKKSNNSGIIKTTLSGGSTLLVAIIAAIGGMVGSYLSGSKLAESTLVPALINAKTICINATNDDERKFRDKASALMQAVAEFDADKSLLYKPNTNQLYLPAKAAITQAMSISSYAPERLSVVAIDIAAAIKLIAVSKSEYGTPNEAYTMLSSAMGEWASAYNEFLKTFDTRRTACNVSDLNN